MFNFWKRGPSLRELVENLTEAQERLLGQFDEITTKFELYALRSEEEKKALGSELKQKTAFIETLFSNMLASYQVGASSKKDDKKDDDNMIDISKLPATARGYIRGKIEEAKKNNGVKKLP